MSRILALAALVVLVVQSTGYTQVKLDWKYLPDTKSVVESTGKTHQVLTLAGMDLETRSTSFSVTTKTNGPRSPDGQISVLEKVDVLQVELNLPGGITVQFDSANADKKADNPLLEPVLERLRVAYETPVTTVLDAMNKVQEIRFPAGVSEKVNEANKSLFDPAKRKKSAEQAQALFPDEPVKPGDTWERSTDVDLGAGQTMAFRIKYTYAGTVELDGQTLDKITAKAFDVSYTVDQASPVRVANSELKVTESDETILFDRERGTIEQKNGKLRIEGPITLIANGTELKGKVDLTIEEKTKMQKRN